MVETRVRPQWDRADEVGDQTCGNYQQQQLIPKQHALPSKGGNKRNLDERPISTRCFRVCGSLLGLIGLILGWAGRKGGPVTVPTTALSCQNRLSCLHYNAKSWGARLLNQSAWLGLLQRPYFRDAVQLRPSRSGATVSRPEISPMWAIP